MDEDKLDREYDDDLKEMTRGRRIARFCSRLACYFPSKDKEGGPSLDKAWAYFEHITLPRHYDIDSLPDSIKLNKKRSNYIKAEYGNKKEKTHLYSVWSTPEKELGDFGVSVGTYFWNLRYLTLIMICAGLLSLPNIIYFSSDDYGEDNYFINQSMEISSLRLEGSSVCTDSTWVPCPNCSVPKGFRNNDNHFYESGTLTFLLRHNCYVRLREGVVTFVTLIFTIIAVGYQIIIRAGARTEQLDEWQQTTSDYAVQVFDPPKDAYDPEDWKEFFSQFGRVHSVTVVLDNEDLVNSLIARREAMNQIKYLMDPEHTFDPDDLENMIQHCKKGCCGNKAEKALKNYKKAEKEANKLSVKEKEVSEVFAIFETEEEQRNALTELSLPGWRRLFCAVPENLKFGGEKTLIVAEAREPSAIRWNNLDESNFRKVFQLVISYIILFILIAGGGVLVFWMGTIGPQWAAITITIINQITPRICKLITSSVESHSSEGAKEASLYLKLTIFKWTNTAIITAFITPVFTTIDNGDKELVPKVAAIFFTELIVNPSLLLLDIFGNLQRHCFGPKARDQDRMNQNFKGAEYLLSLRYAEMTKVLFLTFFYGVIYPAGYFWAAASLTVNYWAEKYCLLRTYGPAPTIGNQVTLVSRKFLFPLMLLVFAFNTAYNFSGWPYDNTCDSTDDLPNEYIGNHTINNTTFTISADQRPVEYCSQNWLDLRNANLSDAIDSGMKWLREDDGVKAKWMSNDQESVTRGLCWVFLVMLGIFVLNLLREFFSLTVLRFFCKSYSDHTKVNKTPFSKVKERYAYIPMVKVDGFSYPLLACDIDAVGVSYINFEDPDSEYPIGYHKHNLIYDLNSDTDPQRLWSVIKIWSNNN